MPKSSFPQDPMAVTKPVATRTPCRTAAAVVMGVMLVCATKANAGPTAASAIFNWTGFYAGLNGGFGSGTVRPRNDLVETFPGFPDEPITDDQKHQLGGAFAGGQVGYNYQLNNNVVLGIETDFQWSNIGARHREDESFVSLVPTSPFLGTSQTEMSITQNWFGTTRLRLGYSFPDQLLAYITGGLAYSQFSVSNTGVASEILPFPFVVEQIGGATTSTRIGWTAGAGLEYALNDRLSLKSEYLYSQYSGITAPYLDVAGNGARTAGTFGTGTLGIHLVRAGLNYRLGEIPPALAPAASWPTADWHPSWSGFYAGVNGGFGGDTFRPSRAETMEQISPPTPFSAASIDETLRGSGFVLGGQFGYSHEFSNRVVAGVETDLQWSGIGAVNRSNLLETFSPFVSRTENSQLTVSQDWFGTTRLRLGFEAFGRGLVYATGGVAYSHFSAAFSDVLDDLRGQPVHASTAGSGGSTRFGWTAGAGFEYALAHNVSFKTEYLYSEYSSFLVPYQGADNGGFRTQGTISSGTLGIHLVRAGVNWKVGAP